MRKAAFITTILIFIILIPSAQAQSPVDWPICKGPAGWLSADVNVGFTVQGATGGIGTFPVTYFLSTVVPIVSNCLANFDITNIWSSNNYKNCTTNDLPATGSLDQLLFFIPVDYLLAKGAVQWFGLVSINNKVYLAVGPRVASYLRTAILKVPGIHGVLSWFINAGLLSETWALEEAFLLPLDLLKWIKFYWNISDEFSVGSGDTCSVSTWFPSTVTTPIKYSPSGTNEVQATFFIYSDIPDYVIEFSAQRYSTVLGVKFEDGTIDYSSTLNYQDVISFREWKEVVQVYHSTKKIKEAWLWFDVLPGVYVDSIGIEFKEVTDTTTVTPNPTHPPDPFATPTCTPVITTTTTPIASIPGGANGTCGCVYLPIKIGALPPLEPTRLPRITAIPTNISPLIFPNIPNVQSNFQLNIQPPTLPTPHSLPTFKPIIFVIFGGDYTPTVSASATATPNVTNTPTFTPTAWATLAPISVTWDISYTLPITNTATATPTAIITPTAWATVRPVSFTAVVTWAFSTPYHSSLISPVITIITDWLSDTISTTNAISQVLPKAATRTFTLINSCGYTSTIPSYVATVGCTFEQMDYSSYALASWAEFAGYLVTVPIQALKSAWSLIAIVKGFAVFLTWLMIMTVFVSFNRILIFFKKLVIWLINGIIDMLRFIFDLITAVMEMLDVFGGPVT